MEEVEKPAAAKEVPGISKLELGVPLIIGKRYICTCTCMCIMYDALFYRGSISERGSKIKERKER